ncbi:MAG TPA: group III truncated hemoglobin [Geminicoccus sp.]|jgi:hemoglobin|uniref:group III truncated hemoglobin n=1 Tax=Geminicoccus sp. TaxID=2024832 RepID=UPI002E2EA979|nr:group III truncated hemoglobin [Geminicoccus sp.]HEX2529498.1 group III truncated hemoglobin [Geminicoccus sp.]
MAIGTFTRPDIDEDRIRRLVHGFYGAVQADPLIGPVFQREIAHERWPVHLEKMCAFWSSVLLRTDRYDGRPLSPHLRMPDLSDEHFQRWLELFRRTAHETFETKSAAVVIGFAQRIAQSFRMSIAFHRGGDISSVRPLS